MRCRPLLMQLLIGMSIRRYLPATVTAGALRCLVNGYSPAPRPPPRMKPRTFSIADPPGGVAVTLFCIAHGWVCAKENSPVGWDDGGWGDEKRSACCSGGCSRAAAGPSLSRLLQG